MTKEHPELSEDQKSGYFRANVGILLINADGLVFAAQREREGSWQLPQGGINQGEEEEQAALREMKEEIGFDEHDIDDLVQPLGSHPGWFAYQLPRENWSTKNGRGQTQKFFAYRFTGDDKPLNEKFKKSKRSTGDEFRNWKWISISGLVAETWEIRRPVYEAVGLAFSEYLA